MSARDVLAMALVRHIEGDSVTRDLLTDDEWAGYLSDADYVSGLIAAAGYAVVPAAEVAALQAEVARLREALGAAANGLEFVAERTWDKRSMDECYRACQEATEMAAGYRDEACAALKEPRT